MIWDDIRKHQLEDFLSFTKTSYREVFSYLLMLLVFFCSAGFSSGFTSDFYSWIATYDEMGAMGFFKNFGDPGLHSIYHGATFFLYKIFDINSTWGVVFLIIHYFNALLIFSLVKEILAYKNIPHSAAIGFWSGAFFLLLPYQTEAVIWKACIHYLLCVFFSLMVLRKIFKEVKKLDFKQEIPFNWKSTSAVFLWFLLAAYSLEIALVWPFVCAAFLIFFFYDKLPFSSVIKLNTFYVLPQFLGIFIYFIHQKILIGQWVGHYGAGTHLNLSPELLGRGLNHYLLKFFALFRYLPTFESKRDIFIQSGQAPYTWLICGLVLLFLLFTLYIVFFTKNKASLKFGLFVCCGFIATIFPVLNLETTSLIDIQSDRYGYFASVFFCIGISFFLFSFLKKFANIPAFGLFFLFLFLFNKTGKDWKDAQTLTNNLIDSYEWFDKENIYVTQLPDNYKGAYVFRNGFREAIEKHHNKKVKGEITRTIWYNWLETDECIKSIPISSNPYQITATLDYGGKWWWWYGAGAGSYEKETHKFEKKGQSYTMTFKNFNPETDVVIYPCNGQWEAVVFNDEF